MKRHLPKLAFLLCLGPAPLPAAAEVSAEAQAEAASAFQALDGLARQTRAKGDLPRLSDPDHAKVLERQWDVEATLGAAPYRAADIPALITIGEQAAAVLKTYSLFVPQAGMVPDTAANMAKYQDEVSRASAYMLYLHAAQLQAFTDFVAALPAGQMNETRRAGLRQMRLGILEQVTGLAIMLRSPALKSENRAILLDALNATAGDLVSATPISDRAAMTAQVDAILPALSKDEQAKAQTLKAALARTDCDGLCALKD